jgi:hypothetical protein
MMMQYAGMRDAWYHNSGRWLLKVGRGTQGAEGADVSCMPLG